MLRSLGIFKRGVGEFVSALSASFSLSNQTQEVPIGVSIGIAVYPADARDMDALVKAADTAMYSAKQSKSCFRFFPATDAALDASPGT